MLTNEVRRQDRELLELGGKEAEEAWDEPVSDREGT